MLRAPCTGALFREYFWPLRDVHLDPGAVDFHWQHFPARLNHSPFNLFARLRLNYEHHAPSPAGPANFAGQSAFTPRAVHNSVDRLRCDGGQVALAKAPLFPHQPSHFPPVRSIQRTTQLLGYLRIPSHAPLDSLITI